MRKNWWKITMVKLEGVLYVLLLLLPLATLHQYDKDGWTKSNDDDDALNLLRTMKRRVSNQLMLQEEADAEAAAAAAAYDDDGDDVNPLSTVKRRQRSCRNWNDPCVPWSNDAEESCCSPRQLICRCNLWMQNCRCVSRVWGK